MVFGYGVSFLLSKGDKELNKAYFCYITNTVVVLVLPDVYDCTQAPRNWSWCRAKREIAASCGNETWIKDISVLVWIATMYWPSTVSIIHSLCFCYNNGYCYYYFYYCQHIALVSFIRIHEESKYMRKRVCGLQVNVLSNRLFSHTTDDRLFLQVILRCLVNVWTNSNDKMRYLVHVWRHIHFTRWNRNSKHFHIVWVVFDQDFLTFRYYCKAVVSEQLMSSRNKYVWILMKNKML